MTLKAIDFEELQDICKHRSECGMECSDDDNFSSECDSTECPIWTELLNSELEK